MGGYFHPVLKIAVFKSKLISKPSVEQIGLAGGFFIGWSNKSGMGDHLEWNVQPDLKSNISISEIARRLGCHKSIISREIKRNTGLRGYRPKQAQSKDTAHKANNAYRISDFVWDYIKHLLSQYYSFEQINGRLKVLGWTDTPSIKTIYQHIYADKAQGGTSHHNLRSQKIYRKRGYRVMIGVDNFAKTYHS